MKLKDGTEISDVKLSINFPVEFEDLEKVEVHIEGNMDSGWYSNVIGIMDLSRLFEEDDLVKVKFILGKINGGLRV